MGSNLATGNTILGTQVARDDAASCVSLHFIGTIAEVALDGGPLNLINKGLLRSLNSALSEVLAASDVRCLILHGGHARAFCAGSDINEFEHLRQDASEHKILFEDMVLRR